MQTGGALLRVCQRAVAVVAETVLVAGGLVGASRPHAPVERQLCAAFVDLCRPAELLDADQRTRARTEILNVEVARPARGGEIGGDVVEPERSLTVFDAAGVGVRVRQVRGFGYEHHVGPLAAAEIGQAHVPAHLADVRERLLG